MADDIYNGIPEIVANRYKKISDEYIQMIARKLKAIGSVDKSDIHALLQLSMYGGDIRKIEKQIADLSGKTVSELSEVLDKVAEKSQAASKTLAELRGVEMDPYKYNTHLQYTVSALKEITNGTFKNISNTTAIGVRFTDSKGNVTHKKMGDAYKDAIDEAIHMVTMGFEDYDTAIAKVLKKFNDSGLRYVDYASGYSRRLDSAVRQNVLDGMRSVYQGVQNELGKEFGADGVEISAHGTCAPDHLPYQGRQYTHQQFDDIQNSLPRQFGMWNCRHSWWQIIIGVSQPAHSEEELRQMQAYSNEKIVFNGKEMTRYEASQKLNEYKRKTQVIDDLVKLAKIEGNEKLRLSEQSKKTKFQQFISELKKIMNAKRSKGYYGVNLESPQSKNKTIKIEMPPKKIKIYSIEQLEQKYGKRKDITFENVLTGVNKKNYDKNRNDYKYQMNCQRCVPTFELRMRGFDVEAKPIEDIMGRDYLASSEHTFEWATGEQIINPIGNVRDWIVDSLTKWGSGARCQISIDWENAEFGHNFAAINQDGKILFIEPQLGTIITEDYFENADVLTVRYMRTDTAKITNLIDRCARRKRD